MCKDAFFLICKIECKSICLLNIHLSYVLHFIVLLQLCIQPLQRGSTAAAAAGDRLIFTGGSDGNDLVRNGVELYEVSYLIYVFSAAPDIDCVR